jgi:hypothetical protein
MAINKYERSDVRSDFSTFLGDPGKSHLGQGGTIWLVSERDCVLDASAKDMLLIGSFFMETSHPTGSYRDN